MAHVGLLFSVWRLVDIINLGVVNFLHIHSRSSHCTIFSLKKMKFAFAAAATVAVLASVSAQDLVVNTP